MHIQFQNMSVNNNQEAIKICSEHPECKDCPLKTSDININNIVTRCETGRTKGEDNNG